MPVNRNSYVFEDAKAYLDGTTLVGKITEIELPSLVWRLIDHDGLGTLGTVQYPTVLEPLETTIKWVDWNPAIARAAADPFTPVNLQIRANVAEHSPEAKVGDRLLKFDIRGKFIENPLGTIKRAEMIEAEKKMTATYVRETFEGEVIIECDVLANILRNQNGDLLEGRRRNLG